MGKYVPLNLCSSIVQCSMPDQLDNGERRVSILNCHMKHLWRCRRKLNILYRSIFEFLSKPTRYNLPDTYQDMFILMRLADFLGCDVFLDFVSSALRVQKKKILNVNSISSVHRLIRNKYNSLWWMFFMY